MHVVYAFFDFFSLQFFSLGRFSGKVRLKKLHKNALAFLTFLKFEE